jgi:hypothetical protein
MFRVYNMWSDGVLSSYVFILLRLETPKMLD